MSLASFHMFVMGAIYFDSLVKPFLCLILPEETNFAFQQMKHFFSGVQNTRDIILPRNVFSVPTRFHFQFQNEVLTENFI